ncbi:MAG: BBP7 family outer membrane beta-barrel protein [Pirellulales bacterium]|nr:BBP7 family outer membrane beta-barrel protein [Pirellulales bacterium]
MKCSLSALAIALLASGIGSTSALGQAVRGPVAFGGASATLTPTTSYYSARYAPPPIPGDAAPQPPTVVTPKSDAPESVAAPEPQKSYFGDIGHGLAGSGAVDPCNLDCGCCDNVCPRWSVWANGLWMGRNMPNNFWTTYESGNNSNQLLYFPGADWGGGFEVGGNYWFGCPTGCNTCGGLNPYCNCCYQNGIQVLYWGIWGMNGNSSIYDPNNNLSTPIDLGFVDFNNNPGILPQQFFDNSRSHRVTRDDQIHNIEINLLAIPCCTGCQNLHLMWLAGVRYFRFTDALQFGALAGTSPTNAQFGDNPADEAFLNADVQNNLVGFQIGTRADYCIHNRWTIFATPKVGIYGNHVTGQNSLYTGDGLYGTFQDSGNALNFTNSANTFSMLASIDVGFTYAFTPNWLFTAGYRVVAASQVALADNQIPHYLADEAQWRSINTNGDLILHGGFAGLEYRF